MSKNRQEEAENLSVDSLRGLPGESIRHQSFPSDFDTAFDSAFPAEEPRENQKPVVKESLKAFLEDDMEVVMIDAPPGFGKSITLYTLLKMLDGDAYYATPLKSLQEQLVEDDFIGSHMTEIMGRNNYPCILPEAEPGTTVDVAKCQRDSDFECDIKDSCPYYSQKGKAIADDIAVVNMSYLMSVPITMQDDDGQFSPRDVMVIDECQNIENWAISFVGVTFSKNVTPDELWKKIEWPSDCDDVEYSEWVEFLREEVLRKAVEMREYYQGLPIKGEDDVKELEKVDNLIRKIERFLEDQEDNHWVSQYDVDINKNEPNDPKLKFKPIKVGRFLDDLLWSKTDKIVLSSATIPKGDWLSEIGLGDARVKRLNIPSPFPVDNRPIITSESVGKMTYSEREENMPDMVRKVKQISEHHSGEKGIIHCRGYNYVKLFERTARNIGEKSWFKENCVIQDRMDREGSLEEWQNGDKQIFLSVNMSEGIDLKGDKCRWQVLLKAKYPNMNDDRVDYRVSEMGDWTWYNQQAVIQLEQAYGRAVRSSTDEAVFYILDSSAKSMMDRSSGLFHDWFLEGVV